MHHLKQHLMTQSKRGFVLRRSEVDHARVMANVTSKGIPLDVRTVLPLGGVGGTSPCDPKVVVLDLVLEGEPLVHKLL